MTVHTGATIYVNVSTDVTINGNWRSLWEATWITAVMFTSRGTW
jgi:hypothetical protein